MIAQTPCAARTAGHRSRRFPACLERRTTMEKVIIPTIVGFAALMSLWAVMGAVA